MRSFSLAALILASSITSRANAFTNSGFQIPTLEASSVNSNELFQVPKKAASALTISSVITDKASVKPHTSLSASGVGEVESKCPVTKFSNKISRFLSFFDDKILNRIIRIANHVPALLSLSYFGLISMASMMSMGPMVSGAKAATATATISSVLTKTVGTTTNQAFASYFPTLITPAPFVFLVWPLIAVLQAVTVSISALFPTQDEILSQKDLSALTLANLCSTAWLLTSSNAAPGNLPLASFLILPFVPLFSAYPLRNKPKYILWAFQVYSSFTTLASMLAFTVEIQYGGRIPFIGAVGKEIAACIFLSLYSVASLAGGQKTGAKRVVNFGAISGILWRRVSTVLMGAGTGMGSMISIAGSLFLSPSFLGTVGTWFWSLTELFPGSGSKL